MRKKYLLLVLFICNLLICNNINLLCLAAEESETVEFLQFNTSRIRAEHYGKKQMNKLLQHIKSLIPSELSFDPDESDSSHDVISFIYADGGRDVFCFFNIEDMWYMKDSEGLIYEKADFVTEYIQHYAGDFKLSYTPPDEKLLGMSKEFEMLDERYQFAAEMNICLQRGESLETALISTRRKMLNEKMIFEYAVLNGYQISEEEAERMVDNKLKEIEKSVNYEEVLEKYNDAGITIEEFAGKNKNLWCISKTIEKVYQEKYNNYKHTDDTIGGVVCNTFDEYWNGFLTEVIRPAMSEYDFSSYEKTLDMSEEYYFKYFRN